MERTNNKERGQAIILVLLGIVGMLAFLSLSIDGGHIFAERRRMQTAADASSLAAATAWLNGQDWQQIGYARAADNGFDNNDADTEVNLTITGPFTDDIGSYYLVTSVITSTIDTYFLHLINPSTMRSTVEAQAIVRNPYPLAAGYAIAATRESCSNPSTGGVNLSGNVSIDVYGGGIFSNACLDANGSALDVYVENGNIHYVTSFTQSGNPTISPTPSQVSGPLPSSAFLADEPDCSGLTDRGSHSGSGTITPGVYSSISLHNGTLNMDPGLYCLTGDFQITGGTLLGTDVTIYLSGNNDFTVSGSAAVSISAPDYESDPSPAVSGLLIYAKEGDVDFSGNSGLELVGSVLAPEGEIKIVGTSEVETGSCPGTPGGPGLAGGHFDIDTSSYISDCCGHGSTDGHVHEYDDKYDVVGADFFNLLDRKLHEINVDITDGSQKFKIIVANTNLSPGGRLVINDTYSAGDPSTYTSVVDYGNIPVSDLTIYSLDGVAGSTKLNEFGMYFDINAIVDGGLHPTNTGDVRKNVPGKYGEWRNGALVVQAVAVNPNGSDAFTLDTSVSNGGHGVATSGLLWEGLFFWHWDGPSYHEEGWDTYQPDYDVGDGDEIGQFVTQLVGDTVTISGEGDIALCYDSDSIYWFSSSISMNK
jgi:Flp pilus assembly protein TadG